MDMEDSENMKYISVFFSNSNPHNVQRKAEIAFEGEIVNSLRVQSCKATQHIKDTHEPILMLPSLLFHKNGMCYS